MSLTEKVEDLYVRLIGNKITATATLTVLGSLYVSVEKSETTFSDKLSYGLLNLVAFFALVSTKCGAGTLYYYRRTEEHIQKYGGLKPRVVELWIAHTTENEGWLGYCQQQGIYLAAQKHGQLEAFYEAKNKVSKITIPHF